MKRLICILIMLSFVLSGCIKRNNSELMETSKVEDDITNVNFVAVGDNLIHNVIYLQANCRTGYKGYDFLPAYEKITPKISSADIAFINQEVPMAKSFKPSNYPRFNSPTSLAKDLKTMGFDVINIANNHMIDKGLQGLLETAQNINEQGLTLIGAVTDKDYKIPVIEKNNIKLSFLGYTKHTNGLSVKNNNSDIIVYTDDIDTIEYQVEQAKKISDVVVVSVHWGEEGSITPTQYQKDFAKKLCDLGVDIIIGTHPHVIQPVEVIEGKNQHKTIVIYSLGNYISAQIEPKNLIGAISNIKISKNHTKNNVTISTPKMDFIITHYEYGFKNLLIYPLDEYTDNLAKKHGIITNFGYKFNLEYINDFIKNIINEKFIKN